MDSPPEIPLQPAPWTQRPGMRRLGRWLRRAGPVVLALGALAIFSDCGPDRRNEQIANLDKLNETLESNPVQMTLDTGGCASPYNLSFNHADITPVAGGLRVDGSLFAKALSFGDINFATGTFTLTIDPLNPSKIIGLIGDGTLHLPGFGPFSELVAKGTPHVSFSVKKGSDLQSSKIPVPNDNHCYFDLQAEAGGVPMTGEGGGLKFGVDPNSEFIMDPSDPLIYFKATVYSLPKISPQLFLTSVAIGLSAKGLLQSTAAAIPGQIVNGHLYIGASLNIPPPGSMFSVSGNTFIRLPEPGDAVPQVIISVDGSLFLRGASIIGAMVPVGGFASTVGDLMHLGDGTSITKINLNTFDVNEQIAVQSVDVLDKLTQVAHVDQWLNLSSSASINVTADATGSGFTFDLKMKSGVNVLGVGMTTQFHTSNNPTTLEWTFTDTASVSIFNMSISGNVNLAGPSVSVSGSASLGGFDSVTGTGASIDGNMSIGLPSPGLSLGADIKVCVASVCDSVGVSFSLTQPSICFDFGVLGKPCFP